MRLRRKKHTTRIEMLPLMDVVFLLLVFFIYSMMSMSVHHGLKLNLPTSSSVELDKRSSIAIFVKQNGNVFIDKDAVILTELPDKLHHKREMTLSFAKANNLPAPELTVRVFAEDNVSYQLLFNVLDQVKAANISKISLQATPESTP